MLLEAQRLSKKYGRHYAVREIDIAIRPGLLSVVGPNGAGKTTLLRMLAGIIPPSRGRLSLNGRDIAWQANVYRDRIGYKPQNIDVYSQETVIAGLQYFARLKNIPPRLISQRIAWALATFHLAEVADRPLPKLSKGERQRFFLAQALLADPDILILDEPTTGLDGLGRIELFRLLNRWAAERIVVVSTHIIDDVKAYDGRILVLRDGESVALAAPGLLAQQADGKVWELTLPSEATDTITLLQRRFTVTAIRPLEAFELEPNDALRVSHDAVPTPFPYQVQLRILADHRPHSNAKPASPTLEEGYLASLM